MTGEAQRSEEEGLESLIPDLYDRLRRVAGKHLRSERGDHTLQATALVHEAYVRLAEAESLAVRGRGELLVLAARAMRRVLVDHARARGSLKRGGDLLRVTLTEGLVEGGADGAAVDLVALDDALSRLAALDPRQVRIVELRFLAGLSVEETAEALALSPTTIKRETAHARAWLARELTA